MAIIYMAAEHFWIILNDRIRSGLIPYKHYRTAATGAICRARLQATIKNGCSVGNE